MSEPCIDPKGDIIIEKLDAHGVRWVKVYVGGGLHFVNWLEQYREVYGEGNVEVEEIVAPDSSCYTVSGEKLFRIWVKQEK
jgi:hypothetical protein